MNKTFRYMMEAAMAVTAAVAAAAVPGNALKEMWGEIEYACFADRQGYLTVARRVPGETGWEEKRSGHRVSMRSLQFAIDGNGRLHIVYGKDGAPLRYVFSLEQGGLDLSRCEEMTGDMETRVRQPLLKAFDDGSLMFIYNSGTAGIPSITINWFSLYDGEWVRLHDSLISPAAMKGSKWSVAAEKTGEVSISWKNAKGDEYEIVSPDGGLTWRNPEGEDLDLPIH